MRLSTMKVRKCNATVGDTFAHALSHAAGDDISGRQLLGIRDQKKIHLAIEVIVCWGINDLLPSDVPIPFDKRHRSKFLGEIVGR
jgi:hypothetical protein